MTTVERPRQYRIILRGECGQLMAAVLEGLLIESYPGWTCVTASVHDESELHELLDRFQDFALHLVSLNELGTDVLSPRASGRKVAGPAADYVEQPGLDIRTHAMVRLAALVAGGEPGTTYIEHVVSALGAGVTLDEIVGVLVTLLPTVGAARVAAFAAATLEASGL
jgi:alkylhydroperoxidase/carboxymuconolactone decarboxylase family protein YurZ